MPTKDLFARPYDELTNKEKTEALIQWVEGLEAELAQVFFAFTGRKWQTSEEVRDAYGRLIQG